MELMEIYSTILPSLLHYQIVESSEWICTESEWICKVSEWICTESEWICTESEWICTESTLSINNLAKGIYLVKAIHNDGMKMEKLLVE